MIWRNPSCGTSAAPPAAACATPRTSRKVRAPSWRSVRRAGSAARHREGRSMPEPYNHILYSVADRIARVTLNAPEKRNALSFAMRDEIVNALRAAEADDDVSVVLIDG